MGKNTKLPDATELLLSEKHHQGSVDNEVLSLGENKIFKAAACSSQSALTDLVHKRNYEFKKFDLIADS